MRTTVLLFLASLAFAAPASADVTVSVVNQAHVNPRNLALVEQAIEIQSHQVAAYWNTPLVHFGPGGWPLYLRGDCNASAAGEHFSAPSAAGYSGAVPDAGGYTWRLPFGFVYTCDLPYFDGWDIYLSHEVVEMLEDPVNTGYNYGQVGYGLEIADAVYDQAYPIWPHGRCRHRCARRQHPAVYVADFVLPAWYAGAQTGVCSTTGPTTTCAGPYLAAADAAGPYDYLHKLSHPWQTDDPRMNKPPIT